MTTNSLESANAQSKVIKAIKYEAPDLLDKPKVSVRVAHSDILQVGVQVVQPHGGETNMHAHPALDSTWMVLSGRAKFYGFGDELIAEAGRYEGVFIPKGAPYWFEAVGDEPLEILHITARDKTFANERVDYAPPVERQAGKEGRGRRPTDAELTAAANSR